MGPFRCPFPGCDFACTRSWHLERHKSKHLEGGAAVDDKDVYADVSEDEADPEDASQWVAAWRCHSLTQLELWAVPHLGSRSSIATGCSQSQHHHQWRREPRIRAQLRRCSLHVHLRRVVQA